MQKEEFVKLLASRHQSAAVFPSLENVREFLHETLGLLFPEHATVPSVTVEKSRERLHSVGARLRNLLLFQDGLQTEVTVNAFLNFLPTLLERLDEDVAAMFDGDPAAKSRSEVILTYPGFYAIAAYRVAHQLLQLGVREIPRMITEFAHSRTGIDIHPGAVIGNRFCIDHGTGVVIGETTIIGNRVKIYQGVTLGALSVTKDDAEKKRHPTIGDDVIIYAGATILGGATVIGDGSIIGGNVWITSSVGERSRVYYQARMSNGSGDGATDLIIIK